MAYATGNPKTKKALREMVASGKQIRVYTPNGLFPDPINTECTIEGPHYPKPHTWYARVSVDRNGYITKVIS